MAMRNNWQSIAVVRWTVLALFTLTIGITVTLPVFDIGFLPVRSVVLIGVLGMLSVLFYGSLIRVLKTHAILLAMIAGFGILGTIVSFINLTDPSTIARQVLEIHVQAICMLIMTSVVVDICGGAAVGRAFIFVVLTTLLFSIGQFLDLSWSWDIRRAIGNIEGETFHDFDYFYYKRPMGLSYTPIVLATQLCLAFATYAILRFRTLSRQGRTGNADPATIIASVIFLLACFASGNRSPILGGLVFILIYFAFRRPLYFFILLPFAVVFGALGAPYLLEAMSDSTSRVADLQDKSSQGRVTLYYFGWRLFSDWPIGYGLAFNPVDHWGDYWDELRGMPNAEDVKQFPLHNYILNMLNFYGIGMAFIGPLIWRALRIHAWTIIFFIPYIAHILFHNVGPLWDDSLVWIVVAIARGGEGSAGDQFVPADAEVTPAPEAVSAPRFTRARR